MVSVLEGWRGRRSWKLTLPLCPIYKSRTTGQRDISLSSLCSKERKLTLNPDTGFEEIAIATPKDEINPKYIHLINQTEKIRDTPENYAKKLVEKVEDYFAQLWNSNRFHLVICSAGMDSRVISWVLANLREKMGKDWVGDIHFRCHGYEGPTFKEIMRKQRWKSQQYSVYKEGKEEQTDYYNIGDFNVDTNAFNGPTVDFFDDIVERVGEKDIALVSGVCGGEIFCYPLYSHRRFTENRFQDLFHNAQEIQNRFCKEYNRWGDILVPYLGYEYLDTAFRIPREYFRWIDLNGQKIDLMRGTMVKLFNDGVPFFMGHRYNMRISRARARYLKEKYLNSKFYRDFRHLDFVREATPWTDCRGISETDKEPNSTDLKLYGYATMYENVKRI